MKITKVKYEKLFSLPNYENEKFSIEADIESGDKASEVLDKLKRFVEFQAKKQG